MSLQITGECEVNRRIYRGGEVIHDAVVVGKLCHVIVNDVGDDKVFLGKNKREKKT